MKTSRLKNDVEMDSHRSPVKEPYDQPVLIRHGALRNVTGGVLYKITTDTLD
jgi:hypothetical protein